MVNQKSLANLQPFKPGKEWKGNRGGRAKSAPFTKALRRIARLRVGVQGASDLAIKPSDSVCIATAKRLAQRAIMEGSIPAFAEMANRVEGTPRQSISLDGGQFEDGSPREIVIRVLEDSSETYQQRLERLKKEAIFTELSEGGAEHDEAHTDGL